jgi:hypothetical protein
MSQYDPRAEIQIVLRLADRLDLPQEAKVWAETALKAVEPAIKFFEFLDTKGHPLPEEIRLGAFERFHFTAHCWIQHDREAEVYFRWRQENGLE